MARSNGKGVGGALRTGYWFTASLAAFVVICLIAAYAGESVHSSTVSLLQQTPVKGGLVAGEQIRRSNLATVEQVASSFKNNWADVAAEVSPADASTEVFSKQLKDLHSANVVRAVRMTQAVGGLIERPCAPTTTVKVGRGRTSTKCYYPTPPNGGGQECRICLSGQTAYFTSKADADYAISTKNRAGRDKASICDSYRDLAAGFFQAQSSTPLAVTFGDALALSSVRVCQSVSVQTAVGTQWAVDHGPYCLDEADVAQYQALVAIPAEDFVAYQDKLDEIAAQAAAKCPAFPNSSEQVGAQYGSASLTRFCGEDVPKGTKNLATGCTEADVAV